jgi:hypothetical protein
VERRSDVADQRGSTLLLTVHGPAGRLDLGCHPTTTVVEVAAAYAERAGVRATPLLYGRDGRPLEATATLALLGIRSGEVLVATDAIVRLAPLRDPGSGRTPQGAVEGGERRRGRRRRHVVRTGDGSGQGSAVEGGRHRR